MFEAGSGDRGPMPAPQAHAQGQKKGLDFGFLKSASRLKVQHQVPCIVVRAADHNARLCAEDAIGLPCMLGAANPINNRLHAMQIRWLLSVR